MKPFTYSGRKTREISFPLGGIGAGCIGLGGAGHLVEWEIFNRPAKASRNGFSHFSIKAESGGKLLDARVLHGDVPPPYSGGGAVSYAGFGFGVSRETMSGMPHFRRADFRAGFPIADIAFRDPAFPGLVTLTAFNPLIPLNDKDSSLPAAFFTITVKNTSRHPIDYTVAFTARNPAKGRTTNRFVKEDGTALLRLTGDTPADDAGYGDFAVATDAGEAGAQEYWYRGGWFDTLGVYWQDFAVAGALHPRHYPEPGNGDHGTLTARLRVAAGQEASCRFVFAWNVPNCSNYWNPDTKCTCSAGCKDTKKPTVWRNYYATLFPDAAATARYCLGEWDRLEADTRLFRDTLFDSTLPPAAIDAVSANISILKTPTCLRLEDGSFYGWEGCHGTGGCCEGSCTHVWNYAYALPFLFPNLERSMRELDYEYNYRPDGAMPFRLQLPLGRERSGFRPCADGQFGGILKIYREWKISGDTAWLRRLWPKVRKSIEFAWAGSNDDQWDSQKTGILHGRQHHTLDMELFGPNAWLSGFYLGALKAGAEMAEACGEPKAAAEFRRLFDRGRKWATKHLFNGDYFVQTIRLDDDGLLAPFKKKDPGVRAGYWSDEHRQLKYQVGEGCGIDQVLAQWHADLIGLGDVFDRKQTLKALAAIYRHNFKASMRDVFNPCRLYCLDDEGGTQMFAWPKGKTKPVIPIPYAEETMHGFEYQAASHLIMNGMVKEGTAMVKAVRDRYDGERRNPWNEIECGSNYARSMASYALLNAFSGFQFDGVKGTMAFRPVAFPGGRFRCFWSLGSAWGEVALDARGFQLRVLGGELGLNSLGLDFAGAGKVSATVQGRPVACKRAGDRIVFDGGVVLKAGECLKGKGAMKCRA